MLAPLKTKAINIRATPEFAAAVHAAAEAEGVPVSELVRQEVSAALQRRQGLADHQQQEAA